ncbi:MAG: hypothetical protein ACREJO_05785 [Phycisphaerales bacterium]
MTATSSTPPTHPPTAPVNAAQSPHVNTQPAQPSSIVLILVFAGALLGLGYLGSRWVFGASGNGSQDPWRFAAGIALLAWLGSLMVPGVRKVTMLPLLMVVGPLVTRGTRMAINGRFLPIEQLPASVSPEHAGRIAEYRAALEAEGFRSGGLFLVTDLSWTRPDGPSGRMLLEPFAHTARRHSASMMLVLVDQGPLRLPPTLQFGERLPSGDDVGVSNSPTPGLFPTLPGTHALQFPGLHDVAELYRIQRAMLQKFAPSYTAPPLRGWEVAAAEDNRRVMERWIAAGWLVPGEREGVYRIPTGRLLTTTWGLTPPIGEIRVWLSHRRSKRIRQELGV